jgi:antibiotic biosynthesis monooxygenase (ABM) superfamily enzyme
VIARIWYCWTTRENAERYEKLLHEEVLLEIARCNIPSYRGAELFIRNAEDGEVEFMTLLRFDSVNAVKASAGDDYEQPVIPRESKKVLKRLSERSRHYRIAPIN